MGILVQSLLTGLCVLAIYELSFPVCRKCQQRTRRWHAWCRVCQPERSSVAS